MSIQIINSGSTIEVIENGGSFNIPKPYFIKYTDDVDQPEFGEQPGRIIIQYNQGTESKEWSGVWTEITAPTALSVSAMKDAIEAFQDSGIGEDVNITGPLGQQNDASSVSVVLSSGQQTVTSSKVTASASVAAGSRSVKFTTSSDFSGKINSVTRQANRAITFSADPGKTLSEITYEITTGFINIDIIA